MTSAPRCMNGTELHLHHLLLAMDPSPSRGSADKHTASHHHCEKHRRQQPVRSARPWAMTHRLALAAISCLQCFLPLPEVLHTSTQPAITTTEGAPSTRHQASTCAYTNTLHIFIHNTHTSTSHQAPSPNTYYHPHTLHLDMS